MAGGQRLGPPVWARSALTLHGRIRAQSAERSPARLARGTRCSKTFTTGTNTVLAAYRYSANGFRDLQDVLRRTPEAS